MSLELPELFKEMLELWEVYKKDVGVVGLAEELQAAGKSNSAIDEFDDTGKWIRFMGGREVPAQLVGKVP